MPGSRDLIQYDLIADQPDIPVGTVDYIAGDEQEYTVGLNDPYSGQGLGTVDPSSSQLLSNDPLRGTQHLDTPGLLECQIEDTNAGRVQRTTEGHGSEMQEYFQSQGAFSYDDRENDYEEVNLGTAGQVNGGGQEEASVEVQVREQAELGAAGKRYHEGGGFGETHATTLGGHSLAVEESSGPEVLAIERDNLYDATSFYGIDEEG